MGTNEEAPEGGVSGKIQGIAGESNQKSRKDQN